ncbi:hypothetical protein QYF36_006341 [Acer negundo]|nr:hypothetical protein QYF36_006341 [Acer negundo]
MVKNFTNLDTFLSSLLHFIPLEQGGVAFFACLCSCFDSNKRTQPRIQKHHHIETSTARSSAFQSIKVIPGVTRFAVLFMIHGNPNKEVFHYFNSLLETGVLGSKTKLEACKKPIK